MFKFLKESVREFQHVVWPTHAETKKYFTVVVILLVLFGLYLFIANTAFAELLQALRDVFSGSTSTISPEISLDDIQAITASGETIVTETSTGIIETLDIESIPAE